MQFNPHDYQQYCIDYIKSHPFAAIFLDMGLGKTAITLTALSELMEEGKVKKALVVAPLRVARDTWPAEGKKWEHLMHLRIAVAVGTDKQRRAALQQDAEIYVINRDALLWLGKHPELLPEVDTIVLDEASSFKNIRSLRTRAAYTLSRSAKRIIALTGTPAANGLEDLWSIYKILDNGQRLGAYLNEYRMKYFSPVFGYGGHITDWRLKPGAGEAITEKIADITVSMKALDHLKMPELISSVVPVRMTEDESEQYDRFRSELRLCLPGGDVSVQNARSLAGKLSQLANGMAYDPNGEPVPFHSRKLEALEERIEAANGSPVLVAYNFRHDLDRISALLQEKKLLFRKLESAEDMATWNRGEIAVGLLHPAAAGHGLNLQEGGHILIWYGLPWSLELYAQTNARLYRQGQTATTVVIEHLVTEGTIDEQILQALERKENTQNAIIDAVKAELEEGK